MGDCKRGTTIDASHAVHQHCSALRVRRCDEFARRSEAALQQWKRAVVSGVELTVGDVFCPVLRARILAHGWRAV
eukprot:scaffold128753_cov60-Phaeocystis_antarctica.AAC.2